MLDVMVMWTADLLQNAAHLIQGAAHVSLLGSGVALHADPTIPDPGDGAEPPGIGGFLEILQLLLWGALALCVAGIIIIGARMGIKHQKGEGGGHMASLGIAFFGCVIIVIANLLVEQIVGAAS